MRNKNTIILFALLIIPFALQHNIGVLTQDCFVQIISVNIEKTSLQIGEQLFVNLTYDLLYDSLDPLAVGAVAFTVTSLGASLPIYSQIFTQVGLNVNKSIQINICPPNWSPNETGQVGLVRVEGWVQDSLGSMTDIVENQIDIKRSPIQIDINEIPSNLSFHDVLNISGVLSNPYNRTFVLMEYPVQISIINSTQHIQTWFQNTTNSGAFFQLVNTTSIGSGNFLYNVTAQSCDDYLFSTVQIPFQINKADLLLDASINASTFLAFYPLLTNCTVKATAMINCLSSTHSMELANITYVLDNQTGVLHFKTANEFSSEISVPQVPGDYNLTIYATFPNHNPINTSLPLHILHRTAVISLESNKTEIAYGDFIELSIQVVDLDSLLPVTNKICSIFLLNQSTWQFLSNVTLDNNGSADYIWQAQDLNNQDEFIFQVVFQGGIEFENNEQNISITNTRNIRIIHDSTLTGIRGERANCTVQITMLDYSPINNASVALVYQLTNETWSLALTNSSGYAFLNWNISVNLELGVHQCVLIIHNAQTLLGIIPIAVTFFDATILELIP